MKISQLKDEDFTNEIITKLVFENVEDDTEAKGDCIVVLGGICPLVDRVPKAVELYKQGRAPKILFSGGVEWDFEYGRVTEADCMALGALKAGVDPKDILRDNLARTTEENMICSALELLRRFDARNVKDLLIVTSLYHMKRSKMIADIMLPPHFKAYSCPAYGYITKDNWDDGDKMRRKTVREAKMMRQMVIDGLIPDFDV